MSGQVMGGRVIVGDEERSAEPAAAPEQTVESLRGQLVRPSITTAARHHFDEAQVEAIRRTVAADCDNNELVMFLELAARYQLDPFARQIWAVKMRGQDASRGNVAIIVGRDGLLSIAERTGEFAGIEGQVVRAEEEFFKAADKLVPHHIALTPEKGGKIIGAWAVVHRRGNRSTYFYAPYESYKNERNRAWKNYPDAMILKCAMANVLRIAFSISGLYEEAELPIGGTIEAEIVEEIDYGSDPEVAERLRRGFRLIEEHDPGSWREAKIRATLAGLDDEGRLRLADELSARADAWENDE